MLRENRKKSDIGVAVIFLMLNIAIFMVLYSGTQDFWGHLHECILDLQAKDSLFCILTPLILIIAYGILPSSWKDVLVFWRRHYPLPGCRAFTHFAKKDLRIDEDKLEAKLGSFPQEPKKQNTTWYELYTLVQDKKKIQYTNRTFLLSQDIAGIAVLFFVFGTFALILSGAAIDNVVKFAGITIVEYILFSIVAHNFGNRLVCNVLVEYLKKK